MKLENLKDLAALLRSIDNSEGSDFGFDMRFDFASREETEHPCGTAACIGGWVQRERPDLRNKGLVGAVASLGAVRHEAYKLCYAENPDDTECHEAWSATPMQAARAVEILEETGKCDWPRALMEVRG